MSKEREKGVFYRQKIDSKASSRACLENAREGGLAEILMTCDPENQGSRQVILSCGGVYQETVCQAREARHDEKYGMIL